MPMNSFLGRTEEEISQNVTFFRMVTPETYPFLIGNFFGKINFLRCFDFGFSDDQ